MIRKRLLSFGGVFVLMAGALVSTGPARADDDEVDGNDSRIVLGYKINPVQLNLRGKNKALVGLGSYLVNAGGACNDCHTQTPYKVGGNPFLGQPEQINTDHYLAGGQCFGPFRSRNLTPDATGKPAGLTFPDFLKIIRTGVDDDNLHPPLALLQVMPWPVYRHLSDRDLKAIYTYLSAIPPAEQDPSVAVPCPPFGPAPAN